MDFKIITAPTRKELFIKQMETLILSGELPVGEKLPTERELASKMGISRAVINTGIIELAENGFVLIKPRVGVYVADYRRTGSLKTLVSLMEYNGYEFNSEEVYSILSFRKVFECFALDLIIENASDEQIEGLGAFIEELNSCTCKEKAAEISFAFHFEISVLSGNIILPLILNSFRLPLIGLWVRYISTHGLKHLYIRSVELYHRILERDAKGAKEALSATTEEAIANGNC